MKGGDRIKVCPTRDTLVDYSTERGTQAELRIENYLGEARWNLWGRVKEERATKGRSSRNLYGIPLSPWLTTKLQVCGVKLHRAGQRTTIRQCTITRGL